MSGHSHYRSIKHKKELSDVQRSKLFAKFANEIAVAAKQGGDIATNLRLRQAVEKAGGANMPKDRIEQAIKRAQSGLEGAVLEETLYEIYGPGGIGILVRAITDNKNRTLSEVKRVLSRHDAKMVGGGGVRWLFELKDGNWEPKTEVEISEKERAMAQALFDDLDELEATQEIYSNLKT